MRRESTDAERKLWYRFATIVMQALKFRSQTPIGPYNVDFLCRAFKLVVEVDGSQHTESKHDDDVTTNG